MNKILLISFLCALGSASQAAPQPNILFILADDLGWSDTTLYGTTKLYQTPNIERLAKWGMTFTRAYSASPLCSPTRSAILTGLSPARTGLTTPNCHLPLVRLQAIAGKAAPPTQHAVQPDPVTRLDPKHPTLSKTLKAAGYATAHFGKWHLGAEPYSPLEHGFDVDIPHWPGPGPAGSFVAPWKYPNFKEKTPGEHIEDRMAAEAVAWMEQKKDRPFFLNYWQFSVHAPFDAKKALIEKYRPLIDPTDQQRSPTYAAMIESFDDAIGTLLDALDRQKLAENTIIIFSSDNGGNMYNEVDGTTPTSNSPLRGGKASMFEGGVRVPQIIVWPGLTKPGTRSDALTQSEDFFPTLLEGLALKSSADARFDGASILLALKGEALPGKAVFQDFPHAPGVPDWLPPSVSVHRDDWKLIRIFHSGEKGAHRYQLFNLAEDLGEKSNLAAQKPELVAELDALIDTFLADTKAVVPIPNPAFDPTKYRPDLEGVQTNQKKAKSQAPPTKETTGAWQTSKDAILTAKDGRLHLTCTGIDPWISSTALPKVARGPFKLTLRLSSTAKGQALVYFTTPKSPRFGKEQIIHVPVTHDGAAHDYEVTLPVETLATLRLDPATEPGEITIEHFDLQDATGKVTSLLSSTPAKPTGSGRAVNPVESPVDKTRK